MEHKCKLDVCSNMKKYQDQGMLLLRVVVGFFFIVHGAGKLWGFLGGPGMEMFGGMITGLGMPLFMAYFVAWVELIAGIALLVGFLVRYASILLGIIMIVSSIMVRLPTGFMKAELDIVFLAIFILFFFAGPGKCSLETKMAKMHKN